MKTNREMFNALVGSMVALFLMMLSIYDITTTGGQNMREFVAYFAE